MACYKPMFAYRSSGSKSKNGKALLNFIPRSKQIIKPNPYKPGQYYYDLPFDILDRFGDDIVVIPCGKCIGCRLEYSRQWATRIMLETMNYKDNYFLTLTYNEDNLPMRDFYRADKSSGEVVGHSYTSTLVKSHMQKFMKDLREYYSYNYGHIGIRFYGCGEYGDLSGRPHYHIIVFNLPIYDLKKHSSSHSGFPLYTSETLNKIWKKGFVVVGDVTFDSSAYVARYVMKKHKGIDSSFYEDNGLDPEFSLMSRNPGIARHYFDVNSLKIYHSDSIFIVNSKGEPIKAKPPQYFDYLLDAENPELLNSVKEKRRNSAKLRNSVIKTDKSPGEYLAVQEFNKEGQLRTLVRLI